MATRPAACLSLLLAGALLTGCSAAKTRSDYDPLEGMNRGIFWFNVRADR